MFDNIGQKFKTLATVSFWIGTITSILIGFIFVFSKSFVFGGLIYIIVGVAASYLGAMSIYALGHIIVQLDKTVYNTVNIMSILNITKIKNEKIEALYEWTNEGLIPKHEFISRIEKMYLQDLLTFEEYKRITELYYDGTVTVTEETYRNNKT